MEIDTDLAGNLIASIIKDETADLSSEDYVVRFIHMVRKDPKIELDRILVDSVLPMANSKNVTWKSRARSVFMKL